MTIPRKLLYLFGLIAVGVGVVIASPAVGAISSDENTQNNTTQSNDTETSTENTENSLNHVNSEVVDRTVQNIRLKAEKKVADERKTRVQLDGDTREQLCDGRKTAIENKVSAFGKAAGDHLLRLDGVYGKLEVYMEANPVSGVDLAGAKAAQTTAASKVAALQSVIGDNTVDCTNLTDNASWLTQVRTAASDAKDALKAYRAELKKVVVSLQQTKTAATQDSDTDKTDNAENTGSTTPTNVTDAR